MNTNSEGRLFLGLEDRVGKYHLAMYGFQHVFAMFVGIITPPLIVAQAGGLSLIFGLTLLLTPLEMILSRFLAVIRHVFPPLSLDPL